jgi:hypothetical protein
MSELAMNYWSVEDAIVIYFRTETLHAKHDFLAKKPTKR